MTQGLRTTGRPAEPRCMRTAVASPKDQHVPNAPWFFTCVTCPLVRQSIVGLPRNDLKHTAGARRASLPNAIWQALPF